MKILHISNFVQKQQGRLYWNHCFKINNGFIRNGHNLCLFSDRDMSRMNRLNKFNNNISLNKELILTFRNFDPDIVVLGHADKIHNRTLQEFRAIKKDIIITFSIIQKTNLLKDQILLTHFLLLMQMSQLNHALTIIIQYHFSQIFLIHRLKDLKFLKIVFLNLMYFMHLVMVWDQVN